MYCKFKDGDLVMIVRDTRSYYGSTIRKWTYGTVVIPPVEIHRGVGYVSIRFGKVPGNGFSTLIPIKDLKKISDKKIPKGSYSTPGFNNGDHVLYEGETRFLCIEGWVVDNKPYYNECKIVIRTMSGKHMLVGECDTRKFENRRYFDTDMVYRRLCNSVYGMTSREFEYCVNDIAVMTNLKKHEQKLKEVSNMLDNGRIVQFKREGNAITATLYDSKDIGNGSKSHSPIISASAKCHPDDRFDLDIGMDIAFTRLMGKWKLIDNGWSKFDKGIFSVRVNKDNVKRFLKMLDEAGYVWARGQKIFDFVGFFGLTYESDDVWFTATPNHRVSWSDVLVGSKSISFDEFCKFV